MLTQCPGCSTTFRVSPVQLKVRAGTVRCGQCSFVFNALETLADDSVVTREEKSFAATSIESPTTIEPVYEPAPIETGDVFDAGIEDTEVIADTVSVSEASDTETDVETDSLDNAPTPKDEAVTSSLPEDYLLDPLLHEPAAPVPSWPWVLGSIVATIGLLLQTVYYYRVELGVLRPDIRPALQTMCKPLHCDVPRPRSIDTLGIDASDLHPDPQQPGHLTLTATLRSKAPYAQEWPLLELTLTDVADRKLAVKHFAASDYLPKDKSTGSMIAAGFPANGEIAVTLPLDVGDLPAVGYRLYVFYP